MGLIVVASFSSFCFLLLLLLLVLGSAEMRGRARTEGEKQGGGNERRVARSGSAGRRTPSEKVLG